MLQLIRNIIQNIFFFLETFLICVKYNSNARQFSIFFLFSNFSWKSSSVLSCKWHFDFLFQLVQLAAQSQRKPIGLAPFYNTRIVLLSFTIIFKNITLIKKFKTWFLFTSIAIWYIPWICFASIWVDFIHHWEYEKQSVGDKTKCAGSMIGKTVSNKPWRLKYLM